jgi:hypothetical protein
MQQNELKAMHPTQTNGQTARKAYKKLALTIGLSFIFMYAVMFLNVDDGNHIYVSTSRTYMALLMVLPMSVIMIVMMSKMYPDRKLNSIIIVVAIILFGIVLAGLRTQTPIGDIQYMKAMIPHHSSAIMTSKNANIEDPEVKKLSEEIIQSQEKEIAQMKKIISRMKSE